MGTILVCLVLSQTPAPAAVAPAAAPAFSQEDVDRMVKEAAAKATKAANAANAEANKKIIAKNKAMAEKLRVSGWKVGRSVSGPALHKRASFIISKSGRELHLDCIRERSGGAWACFLDTWSGCMMVATETEMVVTHGCKDLGGSGSPAYTERVSILRDLHKIVGNIKK